MAEEKAKIVFDPTIPLEQRRQVVEQLLASDLPPSIDLLKNVLRVEDAQIRLAALARCHSGHVNIGTDLAERLLFDSADQVRRAIIPVLSFLPSEDRDRLLLTAALRDSSQENRHAALKEIGQKGLVDLAPELMNELRDRMAAVKRSEPIPAQLDEPLHSHLINLVQALGALRFSAAIPLLSEIAKAQESALFPPRSRAIQALGLIGPQATTELEAIFQHHRLSWASGDPQTQEAARACLRELRAYPTRQRARLLLDICLHPELGPYDLAREILVSEEWLSSSLPVIVAGLAQDTAKGFCRKIIAQWLTNEPLRDPVYKALSSPRLMGDARREADRMVLEFDQTHSVPAGSDAAAGVIRIAVEYLGQDDPHGSWARNSLHRLEIGEDRAEVYARLADRVNARGPLGSAVIRYVMSQSSQERDPELPHLLANKIAEVPPRPARKYSQLLLSLCRQWYQTAERGNRRALLRMAETFAKDRAHDRQDLGYRILVQFEEIERDEFVRAPEDRTLADHPLLEMIPVWLSSGKSRLIKAAHKFLQDISRREHAIPCFSCFALVRCMCAAEKHNLSFFIEQIHDHGGVSEEYHSELRDCYQAEDREDIRLTLIELMETLRIEAFATDARNAVADRRRGAKERVRLIQYLVKVQDRAAVGVLNSLLGDATRNVNKALIEALGEMGDETSYAPLNDLKQKSDPLRGLIDKALHKIFLKYKPLLQSDSDDEISRALDMWKVIGIRVPEAMGDLAYILTAGSPQNRELATRIYGLEGVGAKEDLPLLEERAALEGGDTLDTVRQACQIAILAITGTRDLDFEAQLQNFRVFSSDAEWTVVSLHYPAVGKRTLQELTDAIRDFWDQQHNPSMAMISLNRACEAVTKGLFEMHAVDLWQLDPDLVSDRYLGPRSKQLNRLDWMKKNLGVDISDFKFVDNLRRTSKSTHADKTKRRITLDELQTATKRFVKALAWSIQACENPPPLLSNPPPSSAAG